MGFWSGFWDIATNAGRLTIDIVGRYVRWVALFAAVIIVVALLLIVGVAFAAATGIGTGFWPKALLLWCALTTPVLAVLAFPLIWAGRALYARFRSIEVVGKFLASVAFWSLLLPLGGFACGAEDHPMAVLVLTGVVAILSLGSYAGALWAWPAMFGRGLLTVQLLGSILLAVLATQLPYTARALGNLQSGLDIETAKRLAPPIAELALDDPDRIPPFTNAVGDPILFIGQDAAGRWHAAERAGVIGAIHLHGATDAAEQAGVIAQATATRSGRVAAQKAESDRVAAERIRREAADAEERQQQLARDEAAFRDNHIAPMASADAGITRLAVAVVGSDGRQDETIQAAVATKFAASNVHPSADLLRSTCFVDGTFDRLYDADKQLVHRLALDVATDRIVLGRIEQKTSGPTGAGVYVVEVTLRLRTISTQDGTIIRRDSFTGRGVGTGQQSAASEAVTDVITRLKSTRSN